MLKARFDPLQYLRFVNVGPGIIIIILMKIAIDFPHLKLQYIKSSQNLADFLSKRFNVLPGDIPKLSISDLDVSDLSNLVPPDRVFTIPEWKKFVQDHPQYLVNMAPTPTKPNETCLQKYSSREEFQKAVNALTASLQSVTKNLEKQIKPFSVMEDRISHDNILKAQKVELIQLYEACLAAPNLLKALI